LDASKEAFAVIRDAMKKKKMVGIARIVMARRERVMMLEPFGKGLEVVAQKPVRILSSRTFVTRRGAGPGCGSTNPQFMRTISALARLRGALRRVERHQLRVGRGLLIEP
jgi:Ku70/Ku80 beta-barrel domain